MTAETTPWNGEALYSAGGHELAKIEPRVRQKHDNYDKRPLESKNSTPRVGNVNSRAMKPRAGIKPKNKLRLLPKGYALIRCQAVSSGDGPTPVVVSLPKYCV